jgi:hypothetical protein
MVEGAANGDFAPTLFNIVLLTLAGVLPALSLAYGRQFLLAWRTRPEFSLRRPEAVELDRAVLLYRSACGRLGQLNERSRKANALWQAIFAPPAQIDQDMADEREDLEALTRHLRAAIVRLRRLPLQRLRRWIRILSLRSAFGRAVATHLAVFALLVLAFHLSAPLAAASAASGVRAMSSAWLPVHQSLLQANAGAACLAFILLPGFYLSRRASLGREFGLEFCLLKELAATPPDQEAERFGPQIEGWGAAWPAAPDSSDCWFTVLGVPQSANIGQVRAAYRTLIKGSHPDRLGDLSPAIKRFAEAETKRINVAYKQALASLT